MHTTLKIAAAALLIVGSQAAHAYGSSPSSGHCEKPVFSEFQPATNKYLQSFNEFSFLASSNTTAKSIEISVSAGSIKYHLTYKDLEIDTQKSGRYEVSGKLPRPIEQGFARVSITAHSKPGCERTEGYLIRIH